MTFTHTHALTNDPDTSVEAARLAGWLESRHKTIIRDMLLFWGDMTSNEIASLCELSYLQVARRMHDLVEDKKVVDTGARRASPGGRRAAVWGLV